MAEQYREFEVPVLLSPDNSANPSASRSAVNQYQYLMHAYYKYPTSTEHLVAELGNHICEEIRRHVVDFDIAEGSEIRVAVYEFEQPILPAKRNAESCEEAYKIVNRLYLRQNCVFLFNSKPLEDIENLGNLIAILTASAPRPSTRQLSSVQEVNESREQINREQIAAAAQTRDSPSTGARNANRRTLQRVGRRDALYNHRPLELAPPPITIYHPVFSQFRRLLKQTDVTSEELDNAQDFIALAVQYYEDATTRIRMTAPSMRAGVHNRILAPQVLGYVAGKSVISDGVITSTAETQTGFAPVVALAEVKVEPGDGGCDALAHAECDYITVYATEEARPIREQCCCPAFIIGISGPFIVVSGAVFADRLIAQMLTDYISVIPCLNDEGRSPLDDAGHRIARLFRALKICIADLEKYYDDLVGRMYGPPPLPVAATLRVHRSIGPPIMPPPAIISPHFAKYTDESGEEIALTYTARLLPDLHPKAVFLAEAKIGSETVRLVVKFAYKYNREAHELLSKASPSQAPTLRYCAYEPSVHMYVVVMDYVVAEKVDFGLKQPAHINSLRRAMKRLHEKNLVFGDLRAPNVLLVGEEVVLIDFDWCGDDGQATYPSDIIGDTPMWHPEVGPGTVMRKEHDEFHFHLMTREGL